MAPLGFSTLPMEERPKPKFDDRSRSLVEQDRTLIAVNELSRSIRLATGFPPAGTRRHCLRSVAI